MTLFQWRTFDELSADELYQILKLRQDVFIIEQKSIYVDLDGRDQQSLHLIVAGDDGSAVATLRIVPPGARYAEPSIGRLVVHPDSRRSGLARRMMTEATRKCRALYPGQSIRIQAQQYLEAFYSSLGFVTFSQPYDEDGILHVDMVLAAD